MKGSEFHWQLEQLLLMTDLVFLPREEGSKYNTYQTLLYRRTSQGSSSHPVFHLPISDNCFSFLFLAQPWLVSAHGVSWDSSMRGWRVHFSDASLTWLANRCGRLTGSSARLVGPGPQVLSGWASTQDGWVSPQYGVWVPEGIIPTTQSRCALHLHYVLMTYPRKLHKVNSTVRSWLRQTHGLLRFKRRGYRPHLWIGADAGHLLATSWF